MLYEVLKEKGSWRVHGLDRDGMPLIARFDGQNAYQAASEYAAWQRDEEFATLRAVLYSLQMP